MIAFPSMITEAAIEAGMKVPPDPDQYDECKNEFPHFFVYCCLQLCRPVTWGNHWNNAKIIAAISEARLKEMNEQDFVDLGFDP